MSDKESRFPPDPEIRFTIDCDDLEYALEGFIEKQGYRLFSIFPADNPRCAIVQREGSYVLLKKDPENGSDEGRTDEVIVTDPEESRWHDGRAGMQYRDLLPGRAGGRLIVSHIRIPEGGPVPDYVHFHNVDFQVIYCLSGSSTLVYELQGEPFELSEGDCVLQPPGIRHRVLECSDGFEVLELSSPAEHPTYADHGMDLPTPGVDPNKEFGGQRFQRHVAKDDDGLQTDLGLEEPSAGAVIGEILRSSEPEALKIEPHGSDPAFIYVIEGSAKLTGGPSGKQILARGSSCYIPSDADAAIEGADASLLVFRVRL